ncbi:hypothetical protein [Synechococcus sp. WH 5701]|uniref:hypothetical protein n=1 Tax=Synechococcus sp. WH 5701 TaxID=69042 RepID=UPI0000699693|nr:hypothetical protein [Synechococcus sp. WH 5701]EAQ75066.1 hypothetical protein WH5701_08289 [Synechococcus sp. WH 5701]
MQLLLLALTPTGKNFNMHLAMVVGLGNTGDSHERLASRRQMAVLKLPDGKSERTDNCFFQP